MKLGERFGAPGRTLYLGLLIFLNTAVTSRVDDPFLFEIGRIGADAIFRATSVSGNSVMFAAIAMPDIQPHETRTFQISNVRCNATALGSVSGGITHPVNAYMIVTGTPMKDESQEVAHVSRGIQFEVRNPDGTPRSSPATFRNSDSLPPCAVAALRFTEGFPGAFKVKLPTTSDSGTLDGKTVYRSESSQFGILFESPDGHLRSTGVADYGSRVQAVFNNVPAGVRLFVSISSLNPLQMQSIILTQSETSHTR